MKKIVFIICLSVVLILPAESQEIYSRARIWATQEDLVRLSENGVPVDHGKYKRDTWIVSDFSETELAKAAELGLKYDVLIYDVQQVYRIQGENHGKHNVLSHGDPHLRMHRSSSCGQTGAPLVITDPVNFTTGSMGGYFTYTEFIAHIDAMATLYPNLITAKAPVSTFQTWEGRPIYWLRISDNPNIDENEPEALYTALHHAREPASLSQLIFYMWYLLENYGTHPEVTYLLDNTEMYFIPMINPDGYIQNETTDPSGGGMWRKNKRDNGNGTFGVDLNRNYSYQWGGAGTSTNTSSDTYLGPSAFSEPETQAIKWFTENRDIEIALNYHTYGDLLMHPYGYATGVTTPDDATFYTWKDWMTASNGYANIISSGLYPASGDSDDWLYDGDLATKPKIYAMTPEAGDDAHGFWPAAAQILPICRENVWQNLTTSHILHNYGRVTETSPLTYTVLNDFVNYDVTRLGLRTGNLTVSVTPYGTGILSAGSSKVYNLPVTGQIENDSIAITLDPSLTNGQSFQFVLSISNGYFAYNDTITKVFGSQQILMADDGSSLLNWTSASWNTTTAQYVSAPSSITDSQAGDYGNNASTEIILNQAIDLTHALQATVTFFARWEIEDNYDYVQLQASNDAGASWIPLCGKYTSTGTSDQDAGQPLWDGMQTSWVQEEVNLSDFLGDNIQLRFTLVSDVFVTEDGFYFDDFQIQVINGPSSADENDLPELSVYPNPANSVLNIASPGKRILNVNLYDTRGREVSSFFGIPQNLVILSIEDISPGLYQLRVETESGSVVSKPVLILTR